MVLNVTNLQKKVNKNIYFSTKVQDKIHDYAQCIFSMTKKQILDPVLHINEYADFIAQIRCEGLRAQISWVSKKLQRENIWNIMQTLV